MYSCTTVSSPTAMRLCRKGEITTARRTRRAGARWIRILCLMMPAGMLVMLPPGMEPPQATMPAGMAPPQAMGAAPAQPLVEELQGVKLLLDPRNSTGYEGVHYKGERYPRSRFQACRTIQGRRKSLGSFPIAAEAALCIARSMQTSPQ